MGVVPQPIVIPMLVDWNIPIYDPYLSRWAGRQVLTDLLVDLLVVEWSRMGVKSMLELGAVINWL